MNLASTLVLLVLLIGLVSPLSFLIALVCTVSSLSAMAVIPPAMLGGTSITPQSLAALFFIFRSFINARVAKEAIVSFFAPRKLGLLGGFFIVAAVGAVVLPRLFEGTVYAFTMRNPTFSPITPSMTNITQAGYLFLSTCMATVVCALLQKKPYFLDKLLKAMLAGGCAVIVTGFVDIIANAVGAADMLKVFYTAEYGYSAGAIMGARRVLGLTPEPSSFGSLAVAFASMLIFLRPVFSENLRRWKVPLVGWGCVLMGFLSTSSTAFASLFVLLGFFFFYDVYAISGEGKILRKTIEKKALGVVSLFLAFCLMLLISGDFMAYFVDLVDELLINKVNTSSFEERSSWTQAGIDAFFSSYGLGVGVGSVRTSNLFANILASTGVLGALLFGGFLVFVFLRHAPNRNSREEAAIMGAKRALLPMFAASFLAGTTPDFGVMPALMFGLIVALSQKESAQKKPLINVFPK